MLCAVLDTLTAHHGRGHDTVPDLHRATAGCAVQLLVARRRQPPLYDDPVTALPTHSLYEPDGSEGLPVSADWWDTFSDPPGMRAEVIQGELVLSPSPSSAHQYAVMELAFLLRDFLPAGHVALSDLEWRFDQHGLVAQAPRPDLLVVPRDRGRLVAPPLLVVEVLSPSDRRPLVDNPLLRIDGKIEDYARNGLRHYLEVDLDTGSAKLLRFDPPKPYRQVASAVNHEWFETDEPFRFGFRPSKLVL